MKIAFIGSRGFPGFLAGVEKCLEEVCPRLAEKGHEITLYCSTKVTTKEAVYKGVFLKRTPAIHTKHLDTLSRVFVASIDALFRNYDIVHFHSIGPALLSWITRLSHCKTVVTVHGLDWQRAKWGKLAKACLRIGEQAAVLFPHRTLVVSKPLVRYYREQYHKEVLYIPNGVTLQESLPADQITKKWSLVPQSYLLFVSRLVPEKGCHILIEAFNRANTDKKLVIAGESWHSDDYVAKLKRMVEKNPNILFVGWAEGDLLRELFSNAYFYCLPSEIEGMSLSLLEAMSYGLCPVVSDIPENKEVVGEAGISFSVRDVSNLVGKINFLCQKPETVRKIGLAARRLVQKEYSWDKAASDLEKVYRGLLKIG